MLYQRDRRQHQAIHAGKPLECLSRCLPYGIHFREIDDKGINFYILWFALFLG